MYLSANCSAGECVLIGELLMLVLYILHIIYVIHMAMFVLHVLGFMQGRMCLRRAKPCVFVAWLQEVLYTCVFWTCVLPDLNRYALQNWLKQFDLNVQCYL